MDISKWAFQNRNLVYFLVAVLLLGGVYSCYEMSKLEDPEVKVKLAMVVTTYPGASAHQVELEVTDVLEKNIRTMGNIDNVESYSYNDLSIIQIELLSTVKDEDVEQCWDMLRRKVGDACASLPPGASAPMVKDDFGNVYGMFYALTGDGLTDRELSDYAELIKREVSDLEGVDRVELYGTRPECINISLLQDRMANLGVKPAEVLATLNGQNKTTYTGYYENGDNRIRVTVNDKFKTVDDIGKMLIQGHDDDQLRLRDIARIEKSYENPTRNELFYDGEQALGLLVAASSGTDIIKVGSALALLLGLAYMLWKKIITWHIPVAILGTVFVFSGIMYLVNPEIYVSPVVQLLSGGLMLGAVFMATDYVTSPMSHKGMLIYGVCIGLLTVVIRLFGAYPEGMSFAILIMNAFTPLINTYVKPKRFGEVAKKK